MTTGEKGDTGVRWYRLLAYVLVVVAATGALYVAKENTLEAIKDNQIQACVRGNVLRAQANVNVEVLDDFLLTAENTRRLTAKELLGLTPPNKDLAAVNLAAADKYAQQRSELVPIPPVDCVASIR